MRLYLLLVPALLYSLAAVGANNEPIDPPQPTPERWGDLAPEYGSCDERTRASGAGAPWISSSDSARDEARRASALESADTVAAERRP